MVVGRSEPTHMTYFEYQFLLLSLAGAMCLSMLLSEFALSRFQALPLLFPGMFTVRERRFYFFSYDISDGKLGKQIRADAKMVIRLTLCVVLSYLWQHCVISTSQQIGREFPKEQCSAKADCFSSQFHYVTFFKREYEAIDCDDPVKEDFNTKVVVSCVKFVQPSAEVWLMQLAIGHSLVQLICKSYVVIVWVVGAAAWLRHSIAVIGMVSFCIFFGLFFSGVMSTFVSSWLSFVMSLAVPAFLYIVWKDGRSLSRLHQDDAMRKQQAIEDRLNKAFIDMEADAKMITGELIGDQPSSPTTTEGRSKAEKSRLGSFRRHYLRHGMQRLVRSFPLRLKSKKKVPTTNVSRGDIEVVTATSGASSRSGGDDSGDPIRSPSAEATCMEL